MKHVVFFGCPSQEVEYYVSTLGTSEYEFTSFISTDHKEGVSYSPVEGVEEVSASFMHDKAGFHAAAKECLENADSIIICREPMIPFVVEVYDYISPAARKHFPSKEALQKASMKNLMRAAFAKNCPEFSVGFLSMNCKTDNIEQAIRSGNLHYPVMLKPANEMSSLYVERVDDQAELIQRATRRAARLQRRYDERNRSYDPYLVVEEYIEGKMFTIASWVDSDGKFYHFPVVRVLNAKDIGKSGFYLYARYTLNIDSNLQQQAEQAAEAAGRALGLTSTSMHVELMLTAGGFKLIEIGARIGGYRQWLYKKSYKLDCMRNDLAVRMGDEVSTKAQTGPYAAVVQLFAELTGTIKQIDGIEAIKALASFSDLKMEKQIGDFSGSIVEGALTLGEVFLTNEDQKQLQLDVMAIQDLLEITV